MAAKHQCAEYREQITERKKFRLWLLNISACVLNIERKKLRPLARKKLRSLWLSIMQSSSIGSAASDQPEFYSRSVLQVSQAFITATKEELDYTCVCCNRLMYRIENSD